MSSASVNERNLERSLNSINSPLQRKLEDIAKAIEREAKLFAEEDTGHGLTGELGASIHSHRTATSEEVGPIPVHGWVIEVTSRHAAATEFGVAPGRAFGGKLPRTSGGALGFWAKARPGQDIFALAKHLQREGIKPKRYLARAIRSALSRERNAHFNFTDGE